MLKKDKKGFKGGSEAFSSISLSSTLFKKTRGEKRDKINFLKEIFDSF